MECARCGWPEAYLFDLTPLAEAGTWQTLCRACVDLELGNEAEVAAARHLRSIEAGDARPA